MYGHYRDGILWNRIFCGKAKLDPVYVCFLWRRVMNTVEKKSELDPVHLLYFRDRIWI